MDKRDRVWWYELGRRVAIIKQYHKNCDFYLWNCLQNVWQLLVATPYAGRREVWKLKKQKIEHLKNQRHDLHDERPIETNDQQLYDEVTVQQLYDEVTVKQIWESVSGLFERLIISDLFFKYKNFKHQGVENCHKKNTISR